MIGESKSAQQVKYAYLKTNHSVQELQRVCADPDQILEGGPDAYVSNFVRLANGNPGLLLSVHFSPEEDAITRLCNIEARSFYWRSRRLKWLGSLAKTPIGTFTTRLVTSLKILLVLVRFRPTQLLCWAHSFPLWAAFIAARVSRCPFVYSRHTRIIGHNEPWYLRLTNIVDEWIMRHAGAVVVHGPYLRQQMLEIGVEPERLFEFNWAFGHLSKERQASEALPEINKDGSRYVVLFVGRIQKDKGVFDLLDACTDRLRDSPDTLLVFAGEGSDSQELARRIAERGLQQQVLLLGMLPHSKLSGVIRQATVVVTPTRTNFPEGRCMATMEALVMGVPVIAPDWGPFPYLVRNEQNGLLFMGDSVDELKRAIVRVLDDGELYVRLRQGADASGKELRNPAVGFLQAVNAAFERAGAPKNLHDRRTI
jgi:glycosyltransferase involved in cell wall biosynthesis